MFGLSFNKLPANRKFNYKPIYYDEAQEELDQQVSRIKREMGEEKTSQQTVEESIRSAYRNNQTDNRYSNASNRFYPIKILVIAGILGWITIKLLNSNIIEIIFGQLNS